MGDVVHLLDSTALDGGDEETEATKQALRDAVDYACSSPITGYMLVTITRDGLGPVSHCVNRTPEDKCKLVGHMESAKQFMLGSLSHEDRGEYEL